MCKNSNMQYVNVLESIKKLLTVNISHLDRKFKQRFDEFVNQLILTRNEMRQDKFNAIINKINNKFISNVELHE